MVIRMKELSTLIPELRQIALDSGANDLRLIATDTIKTRLIIIFWNGIGKPPIKKGAVARPSSSQNGT